MINPAGKECKHYFQDFHRGRNVQECRLIKANPDSERWHPSDCEHCSVPDILLANNDPNMRLIVTIKKGFLGFKRRLEVTAVDKRDGKVIEDPYVGRLDPTNPGLEIFRQALEEDNDD